MIALDPSIDQVKESKKHCVFVDQRRHLEKREINISKKNTGFFSLPYI